MVQIRSIIIALPLVCACGGAPAPVSTPTSPEPTGPPLEDPLTRAEALGHLASRLGEAVSAAGGDHSAPAVVALADETVADATRAYVNVADPTYRGHVLAYLFELRDPRALNAFVEALGDADPELADHRLIGARAIGTITFPEEVVDVAVAALARSLLELEGNTRADDRFRATAIRSLSKYRAVAGVAAIATVAARTDGHQSFSINALALETLGELRDPVGVNAAIEGLFLFDANDPATRIRHTAALTLTRIGEPAVAPLLSLFSGTDAEVRPLVSAYVDAVHAASPDAELSVSGVTSQEAALVLGNIGDPAAFDALLSAATGSDPDRRLPAALALARLDVEEARWPRIRAALESAYAAGSVEEKVSLIGAMQRRIDPGSIRFLSGVARSRRADDVLRASALSACALIALGSEARPLLRVRLPDEGVTEAVRSQIERAVACGEELDCWLAVDDTETAAALERLAYALGRLGADDARTPARLLGLLTHDGDDVRLAALDALDRVGATQTAAARLLELAEADAADPARRRAWGQNALMTAARFEARAARRTSTE